MTDCAALAVVAVPAAALDAFAQTAAGVDVATAAAFTAFVVAALTVALANTAVPALTPVATHTVAFTGVQCVIMHFANFACFLFSLRAC